MSMAEVNDEKIKDSNKMQENASEVNFDSIVRDEVGDFGWFQKKNIIFGLLVVIFVGWSNNSYVFTAARISTRCHIPECDYEEPEFLPSWLLNAIPGSNLDTFDNCQRYGNATAAALGSGACPADWFDQAQAQDCDRYLYHNSETLVYDFELACDEWRRSLIGTFRLFGTMFAQALTGLVSDRWGRRTALIFNVFNSAWMGVLRSFSNSYYVFITAEFFSSVFGSAVFQSSFILLVELSSPKNRVILSACTNTFLSVGLMTLGMIAWTVPYWRNLLRALFIPQFIIILYPWLMSESIRWYLSNGRYEDTEKALKNMARDNKKYISDKSLELLKQNAEKTRSKQERSLNKEVQNAPSLIQLLIQHKKVLVRCLITPFMWITFTLVYQGITINAVDISGNKYVNYISVAAAQIPGFWISFMLLDRIGRKPVLIAAFWTCAICQIVFIFVPKGQYVLSLSVYMVGACCSGAILSALYIYTAELYPTRYRHTLFGFSSCVGRLGAVLAPLTPALSALVWVNFPFALFAGFACVSGALVLLTPETRGERLPDTMQEAADLGRKKANTVKHA